MSSAPSRASDPGRPPRPGTFRPPGLVTVFRSARRRPGPVLGAAVMMLVLAGWLASSVRVETDVLSLIPSSNRPVAEFRATLERFGSLDLLLVALELGATGSEGEEAGENGRDLGPALHFADLLAAELRATEGVEWLEYRSDEARDAVAELVPYAPLFLAEDELAEILETLADDAGLELAAAELAQSLRSPANLAFGDLRRVDPLGLVARAWSSLDTEALDRRFDPETGYLIDPEGRFVLLLVKPERPAADVAFGRQLLASVRAAEERAAEAWKRDLTEVADEGEAEEPPAVILGGGHAVAVADADGITRDLMSGTAFALTAVALLFAVAFRRWAALPVAFAPLLLGLALTFAFAALALGRLNAVTAAFAALLVGLGIDFVIVLYGRYAEERSSGRDPAAASEVCALRVAPSVLLGAVTTAVTFFAFLVSDFEGLWELGLLTGGGILLVLSAVFVLFPAVLAVVDRRKEGRADRPPVPLQGFGSQGLFRACYRRPLPVLALNLAASGLLGLLALGVEYDDDALSMRSSNNAGLVQQNRIMDAFGLRFTPYMVRVDGATEREALERARSLLSELEALEDGERLARVESALPWIPPFARQEERLAQLRAAGLDPAVVRARFETALRERGLRPAAFAEGLANLERALSLAEPAAPSDLAATSLGHALSRYVAVGSGDGGAGVGEDGAEVASTVIYAYPPPGRWRREPPPDLVRIVEGAGIEGDAAVEVAAIEVAAVEVAAVEVAVGEKAAGGEEWAVLTGGVIVSNELKRVVWRDALLAGLVGSIGVLFFLAWDLRSFRKALLALFPLALGLVWMLGWMSLAGMAVNFMNLFVFSMILGIGVDYGIHLLHRLGEGDDSGEGASASDVEAAAGLAPAITVAALTTVAGFGSLVLSDFPGLRSMGGAAIFGVLSVAWLGLTLLPALAGWRARR